MFKPILDRLLQKIEGSEAAFVVGLDGLLVDCCSRDKTQSHEQLAAECSALLKAGFSTVAALPADSLAEIALVAGNFRLLLRMLSEAYFVGLLLSQESSLGQARFEVRKIQFELQKELAL